MSAVPGRSRGHASRWLVCPATRHPGPGRMTQQWQRGRPGPLARSRPCGRHPWACLQSGRVRDSGVSSSGRGRRGRGVVVAGMGSGAGKESRRPKEGGNEARKWQQLAIISNKNTICEKTHRHHNLERQHQNSDSPSSSSASFQCGTASVAVAATRMVEPVRWPWRISESHAGSSALHSARDDLTARRLRRRDLLT